MQDELQEAIDDLTASLDLKLWEDDLRLKLEVGDNVLTKEGRAIGHLKRALDLATAEDIQLVGNQFAEVVLNLAAADSMAIRAAIMDAESLTATVDPVEHEDAIEQIRSNLEEANKIIDHGLQTIHGLDGTNASDYHLAMLVIADDFLGAWEQVVQVLWLFVEDPA